MVKPITDVRNKYGKRLKLQDCRVTVQRTTMIDQGCLHCGSFMQRRTHSYSKMMSLPDQQVFGTRPGPIP